MVCVHTTTAELSSYVRNYMASKAKNIYYLFLYRKNLPTPADKKITNSFGENYDNQLFCFRCQFTMSSVLLYKGLPIFLRDYDMETFLKVYLCYFKHGEICGS